jgi:hypothetical protein
MDTPTYDQRVAKLERQLSELRAEKAEADKARREAVPVIMQYTISKLHPEDREYRDVYDDTARLYKLEGRVVNKEEAEAVGHRPFTGAMVYVYSTVTKKIIMATSGGTIFISAGWTHRGPSLAAATAAFEEVNAFLAENPDGGDITEIVTRFKAQNKED